MRLEIRRVEVKSITGGETPITTEQRVAFVFDGKRCVYRSVGYHYATEAREAGMFWIERNWKRDERLK